MLIFTLSLEFTKKKRKELCSWICSLQRNFYEPLKNDAIHFNRYKFLFHFIFAVLNANNFIIKCHAHRSDSSSSTLINKNHIEHSLKKKTFDMWCVTIHATRVVLFAHWDRQIERERESIHVLVCSNVPTLSVYSCRCFNFSRKKSSHPFRKKILKFILTRWKDSLWCRIDHSTMSVHIVNYSLKSRNGVSFALMRRIFKKININTFGKLNSDLV